MKSNPGIIAGCVLLLLTARSVSQVKYDQYFTGNTLRFDFLLSGNEREIRLLPVQVKQEPFWGGSRWWLIDDRNLGSFRYDVYDAESGTLIFRKGFCTLFQEWQTTAEARKQEKACYQAIFFPFPKGKIKMKIDCRDRKGNFNSIYESLVDPDDYHINREAPEKHDWIELTKNGQPEDVIDILFLAEGYAAEEKEKYKSDVSGMCSDILGASPFKENRDKFHISALWTPSPESGTDIPGEGIYRNTRFNSTFYTFDVARYLTTSDMKSVYDAAASVPWDYLIVAVNSERYGGGGFYNLLTVCTSSHELTPKVLIHEFGHAFAGLADEYYTSDVAYENYYDLQTEPWEPNITTLIDFSSKWKSMVNDSVPVPTPRIQKFRNVTGVFEGGGYMDKGIYSPAQDCRMKSNNTSRYCPVCQSAISRIIERSTRP